MVSPVPGHGSEEYPPGTLLKIEVGGAAKNHLQYSGVVAIQSDNTAPTVHFDTLAWKFASVP